jgi:hypothetical protein
VFPELLAHALGRFPVGRRVVAQKEGQAEGVVLVGSELVERQDVDPVDVAQPGQEGAEAVDGFRVVGPAGTRT